MSQQEFKDRCLNDKIIVTKYYFGVFSFYPDNGWLELTFLGKHDTEGAADRALINYLKQPENKSANKERYQIRSVVTTYHALSEFEWDPDRDCAVVATLKENLK